MAVYSDLLKELRKDKHLTQKMIGEFFNMSGPTYSMYENGRRRMSVQMLSDLADILGTSTDYLLGRTDNPVPYPKRKK